MTEELGGPRGVKIMAADGAGGEALLELDPDTKALKVALYVWDTNALDWIKAEAQALSADDLTAAMGDIEKALLSYYWKDEMYEWSTDDLIYIGKNTTHKAATSATTWHVWKRTYAAGKMTRQEGPLTGSWDGRAGLAWE